MQRFSANVHSGIVNDKKKGPTNGTWILAKDIPAEFLEKYNINPKTHPHAIEGMAWCLSTERDGDVYQWRRLANAEVQSSAVKELTVDPTDSRWFY